MKYGRTCISFLVSLILSFASSSLFTPILRPHPPTHALHPLFSLSISPPAPPMVSSAFPTFSPQPSPSWGRALFGPSPSCWLLLADWLLGSGDTSTWARWWARALRPWLRLRWLGDLRWTARSCDEGREECNWQIHSWGRKSSFLQF